MLLKRNLFIQFRTYDPALQACLVLKVEINQSGDLHSSDFLIKYFILRVLTSHSRFWNANIVWMGWCTDWFFWVPLHVFCLPDTDSTSIFAGFPGFGIIFFEVMHSCLSEAIQDELLSTSRPAVLWLELCVLCKQNPPRSQLYKLSMKPWIPYLCIRMGFICALCLTNYNLLSNYLLFPVYNV